MYVGLHVQCSLFVSDFNKNLNYLEGFIKKKNPQTWNFMKIRPVGADLFHADGQTGKNITKLLIPSRNFAITLINTTSNYRTQIIGK